MAVGSSDQSCQDRRPPAVVRSPAAADNPFADRPLDSRHGDQERLFRRDRTERAEWNEQGRDGAAAAKNQPGELNVQSDESQRHPKSSHSPRDLAPLWLIVC